MPISVIKFGGEVLNQPETLATICQDVATLHEKGHQLVIVHGGGAQVDELCRQLGITPKKINCRRITDEASLEAAKMILAGTNNTNLLAALRKVNVPAVGVSGVDAELITAHKRPPRTVTDLQTGETKLVDFGFVGDLVSVNPTLLRVLLAARMVPVVSPLVADETGQVFNTNADTVATELAIALRADQWIAATTVDGVLDANQQVIPEINPALFEQLAAAKVITGGMYPKLTNAFTALNGGVTSVHIVNGQRPGTLVDVVIGQPVGTRIQVTQ
ncbi:MAG TPA: acetylglutamate kinase [Acidobacteriota bacterium]|nr:acetylglutamate kinase [Acidobacteriota bacterium]